MILRRLFGLGSLLVIPWQVASAASHADAEALFTKASGADAPKVIFSDGTNSWADGVVVYRLASGHAVIVKTKSLALDTAGAPYAIRYCDEKTGMGGTAFTALSPPGQDGADSNATPYIVLPGCDKQSTQKCKRNSPHDQLGLRKGDLAAVISGDKITFAIAADYGQEKEFGEGSIELHRELGHEVVGATHATPQCAANESLDRETYFVIFPHSNRGWLPNAEIARLGAKLWQALLVEESLRPTSSH